MVVGDTVGGDSCSVVFSLGGSMLSAFPHKNNWVNVCVRVPAPMLEPIMLEPWSLTDPGQVLSPNLFLCDHFLTSFYPLDINRLLDWQRRNSPHKLVGLNCCRMKRLLCVNQLISKCFSR